MNPGGLAPGSEHLIFTLQPSLAIIGFPSPIIKKRLILLCFYFVLFCFALLCFAATWGSGGEIISGNRSS